MRSYVTLFTISFVLALLATPAVRRKAVKWGAVAVPDDDRHIHAQPTPRLGGVAIYAAFLATLLCVPLLGNMVSEMFREDLPKHLALLAPATLMFLFGIYDDFRGASATLKVAVQTAAAAVVYGAGYGIENVSSPFATDGSWWHLPGWLSFPVTALWIIGITNAFNLLDGIDGLAAGASVFALLSILVFSIAQGNPEISLIAVVLAGAVLGFLRYNFNPATIFMGDSGSLFLGFMAAVLSLVGSQKGSTIVAIAIPLVSFGLPVTEAGLSLVRRFLGGQPLLRGDRGHIHHRLLDRGLTQRQAAILLYGVSALFALFGLMLLNPARNLAALVFFVLGVGIVFGVQRLRYAEFSELGVQLKQIGQDVSRLRRSLAASVQVRRASDGLAQAESLDALFTSLRALLASSAFDRVELEAGAVFWEWTREEPPARRLASRDSQCCREPHCWMLRVPLTDAGGELLGAIRFYQRFDEEAPAADLAHLCGSLPRELSAALSRLLAANAAQGCIGMNSGSS
jgi:UDP-GlcNAc:undecaprenyl-phosphate/decaprenyl-phosphate GlcNAc-1-phosphate transferase